jgi:hypothetical protein
VGTFHRDAHALHGITCVAEGRGARTWVGRVDTVEAGRVILLDADVHEDGPDGPPRAEWLARTAAVGPWNRFPRVAVPLDEVATLRPLAEYAARP